MIVVMGTPPTFWGAVGESANPSGLAGVVGGSLPAMRADRVAGVLGVMVA